MKVKDKDAAKLSLDIIKQNQFKKIKLGSKNVDKAIVDYARLHDVILATLDRELKKLVNKKILTIRGKKSLELI